MHQESRYILHAGNSQEFEQTGERDSLEQSIARVSPNLTAEARRRVSRQIARGLEIFGREAINLGIQDLVAFESRLKATPIQAMGYPASLKKTLQNAVRHLHVAARDGSADDLRQVLHIKRRNMHVDAEPLPMRTARDASTARAGWVPRDHAGSAAPREPNVKRQAGGRAGGTASAPKMAELDGVIERLAGLQQRIGTWNAQTEREVIGMLVETFSDAAVMQILATLPDGYRQPVADPAALPDRPSVGDVARRVLVDTLVRRRARLPQA